MKNLYKAFLLSLLIILVTVSVVGALTNVRIVPMTVSNLSATTTVAITATAIPATALSRRDTIVIYNNSAVTVFIGHAGVSIANGYPLKPSASITIDSDDSVVWYGIVAAGTANVRSIECK